jgi:putative transposase
MELGKATGASVVVQRPRPTQERPQGLCLDRGEGSAEGRATLQGCGLTAHIRARGEEARALKRQAGGRARRGGVERPQSWMNRFRRVLIRWDKKGENYLAFLHSARALIAFRASGLFG